MKALTVWQPWAMLIAEGLKLGEFRSWPPPKRLKPGTTIAIHAATRRPSRRELRDIARYISMYGPLEHAIINPRRAVALLDDFDPNALIYGQMVALVDVDGAEQQRSSGLYRWNLSNIRTVASPPVRGYQQLWTVPPDLEIFEVEPG